MTGKELRGFLKSWVEKVLVDEMDECGLIVIASNQNAPIPDGPHITINYNGNRNKVGRAAKPEPYFNDEDETDEKNGTRLNVSDWGVTLEIRETHGEGDRLRVLVDSLDRDDIYHTYFVKNGIAHYGENEVMQIPRLDNESWIKEAVVELQLGIAEGTRETTSWIDTVDYEGDIGGLNE